MEPRRGRRVRRLVSDTDVRDHGLLPPMLLSSGVSRLCLVQTLGACLGASAAQRGPLWWVAHHRRHHQRTDRTGDPHSPVIDNLASSHVLWMFAPANQTTDTEVVPDLAAYPEMRLLDRFHHVMPIADAAGVFLLGSVLQLVWPGLHTSGLQMLVFGFSISTVLLYQATFAVNSLGHTIGSRRFETKDASHNIWWLALLTLGEGWHNNHHRFPYAARAGLAVWEADMTWMALRLMARLKLVRTCVRFRHYRSRAPRACCHRFGIAVDAGQRVILKELEGGARW